MNIGTKLVASNVVLNYRGKYIHATRRVRDEKGKLVPYMPTGKEVKKYVVITFTTQKGYREGDRFGDNYAYCKKIGKKKVCVSASDLNTSFLFQVVRLATGKRFIVIKAPNFYLVSRGTDSQQEVVLDTQDFDPYYEFPGSTDWVEIELDKVLAMIDAGRLVRRIAFLTGAVFLAFLVVYAYQELRVGETVTHALQQKQKERKRRISLDAVDRAQAIIASVLSEDLGGKGWGGYRHIERIDFTNGTYLVASLFPEPGFTASKIYKETGAVLFGKEKVVRPKKKFSPRKDIKYCFRVLTDRYDFKLMFRGEEKVLVRKGKVPSEVATSLLYALQSCPVGIAGKMERGERLLDSGVELNLEVKLHER